LETKNRPISFASHFDALLLSFYSFYLSQKYQKYIREKGFDPCILAYRNDLDSKCNIQFAGEVFQEIKTRLKSDEEYTAIAIDIKGYFDTILHTDLKQRWKKILNVEELPS